MKKKEQIKIERIRKAINSVKESHRMAKDLREILSEEINENRFWTYNKLLLILTFFISIGPLINLVDFLIPQEELFLPKQFIFLFILFGVGCILYFIYEHFSKEEKNLQKSYSFLLQSELANHSIILQGKFIENENEMKNYRKIINNTIDKSVKKREK